MIDAEQHFQIDPLTAPFVLETFKRCDGGETIFSIINCLNEQGLTNTRGQKMAFNSVGHMLHNRRYSGEFQYRDVIVPDGIPAIVPQDLFDRVQDKLVITFNYKEGAKNITFAELQDTINKKSGSDLDCSGAP